MNVNKRPPTDLRSWREQNERRLLMAAVFLLVVVGGILIGLFIGPVLTALVLSDQDRVQDNSALARCWLPCPVC